MTDNQGVSHQDPPPPYYGALGDATGSTQPASGPSSPLPGPDYSAGGYPSEPPPKYEPPKDQDFPGTYANSPAQDGYQANVEGVQHTIYVHDIRWGPHPQLIQCPHCYAQVTTCTSYKPGALTWLSGGLICLFGCWMGCCLIPLCIPDLQDVEHRCPNCGHYLGMLTRI